MDGFDGLVVIDPDGPELGIQIRQAQVVVVRVLVGLNDFERSAEDAAANKLRSAFHSGFEHHVQQLRFLLMVQPEIVVVRLGVCDPCLFFHILIFKVNRLGRLTNLISRSFVSVAQTPFRGTITHLAICSTQIKSVPTGRKGVAAGNDFPSQNLYTELVIFPAAKVRTFSARGTGQLGRTRANEGVKGIFSRISPFNLCRVLAVIALKYCKTQGRAR